MKAIVIDLPGSAQDFKEAEVDIPKIEENQVLVEVHAASVNPVDIEIREKDLDLELDSPAIITSDISGIVAEVGNNVTDFSVGDEVFGNNEVLNDGAGGFGEFTATDASLLVKKPKEISFEQASTLGIAPLTAYQLVNDAGNVQERDYVFIKGGSGGVGTFAIQFAKKAGAYVAATTSQNESLLNELGVDQVINYKETEPTNEVEDADVLIVTVGEGDDYLKSVKRGGHAVTPTQSFDKNMANERNISTQRITYRKNTEQLKQFAAWAAEDKLKIIIEEVFPLTAKGVQQAHELSESGHTAGKIVVKVK